MSDVIGIDLGTTNSCVAVVEQGVPKVLPNRAGYRTTPSIVAITESGRRLIGHIAKRQAITNPEGTVYGAKRLVGRKWSSPAVAAALETCAYHLVEGPHHDVRIILGSSVFSLPEISSMILSEMKLIAEQHLGREIDKCCVTVPAYFDDGQRKATKDAGRIAGLEVVRIINEPTAAALAYGRGKTFERKIAVFDLGGGTFDISILEISNGVFEVIATAGDTYLGGEDFDNRIVEWLVFGFLKEHQIDMRTDRLAMQRLRDAAETAKIELSSSVEAEINLPFIISTPDNRALHLQRTLTRQKLEELVIDLCERCLQICDKTLTDAGVRRHDLDDVILVGGQTRMPRVQAMVQTFFGRPPSKNVNADEVVALGAAIQGAALFEDHSRMLLLDVTPHDLGIMIVGGYFQTIDERNTTVPTTASHVFTTVRDNQTSVRVMVHQGSSLQAVDNELLGEFTLTGLRRAPKGELEIEIGFEISADGILAVRAMDLETGQQQSITVTATSGLTDEEVQRMAKEAQRHAIDIKHDDETKQLLEEVRSLVNAVEAIMPIPAVRNVMTASPTGREALARAEQAVQRGKMAYERRALDDLRENKDALARAEQAAQRGKMASERRALDELRENKDALERVLRMLRGILDKLG